MLPNHEPHLTTRKQWQYETALWEETAVSTSSRISDFSLALGSTTGEEYSGRPSKNGKKSGGCAIESGNSVFELTVTTGQMSFLSLQVLSLVHVVKSLLGMFMVRENSSESFSVFLQILLE